MNEKRTFRRPIGSVYDVAASEGKDTWHEIGSVYQHRDKSGLNVYIKTADDHEMTLTIRFKPRYKVIYSKYS
ncbi:hypothetical protein Pse7367_3682 (plasmid) [Thalassoporum mexicanum PCC 7367]|uniref:hypothetical protein n=1 Tax=Thalassoporum mexicanum TaxID=3457544 RepID=UPI00029F9DF3|nr:hypothetical protein [Pseudanabaena sp. PCC 7367]AFY71914.1 hypothetical protein Pse7367_3682 [Pseudanabaena sp. PCC 7367]